MKMYRESVRRLLPIGLSLGVATMIYTLITGGQDCFGTYTRSVATAAVTMTPVLNYYVFSAALFALYGFGYLFRRPASDLFHSLPVNRMDLYLSNLLATATWMGATILLNVLTMLVLQLSGGCPFVPAYVPLTILFYFVAAMLVYAAAAVGCALSGTFLTALISMGIVLFLPRFVQFILARGVVAGVPIIGWLDLGIWLNPMSNVATGLVVMHSRDVFMANIVALPYILYSLLPMALELGLGAWLFLRRPSETAEHGAGRRLWALATACLLAFTVLIVITVGNRALFSMYGGALVAFSFLIYVVYQLVSARSIRQVVVSLPCFLLSGALAFGVSLTIGGLTDSALRDTPAPEEIASVTFRGHDYTASSYEYATLLLSDIRYTSEGMKKYVSEALRDAVDNIRHPENLSYLAYNPYQVIEPITLRLTSGRTVLRTIEFANIDALNELREEDSFFQAAIRSFPATGSVQYLYVDSSFTKEESAAVWSQLVAESQQKGLISNDYYRKQSAQADNNDYGYGYRRGDEQALNSIAAIGYVADRRFADYRQLRLETPETVSLVMRTSNQYREEDTLTGLLASMRHIASPLALENDSLNLDMTFYNVPREDGEPAQISVGFYISGYGKRQEPATTQLNIDYAEQFVAILQRAVPTDDPTGMFVWLTWNEYDSSNLKSNVRPDCYLGFSKEDQQALTALISQWQIDMMRTY